MTDRPGGDAGRVALRRAVATHAGRLAPGPWVFTGQRRMVRHWRAPGAAGHLADTRPSGPRALGALRRAVARARIVGWPLAGTGRGTSRDHRRLLLTADGGCLLLDDADGTVLRLLAEPVPETYVADRREFAAHVPCPDFEVIDGGRGIRETAVAGGSIAVLDGAARVEVLERLLDGYAALVAASSGPPATGWTDRLDEAIEATELPPGLRDWLRRCRPRLVEELGSWPTVISHGDLGAHNLIVGVDGPVVIDLEARTMGRRPFFHDPACLVLTELRSGRADLARIVLDPSRSAAVRRCLERAGVDPVGDGPELLLAAAMVGTWTDRRGTASSKAVLRSMSGRWEALRPLLNGGAGIA